MASARQEVRSHLRVSFSLMRPLDWIGQVVWCGAFSRRLRAWKGSPELPHDHGPSLPRNVICVLGKNHGPSLPRNVICVLGKNHGPSLQEM